MKKIKLCKSIFILLLLFLSSCNFNDLKDLKKKKIKVDKITRLEKDRFFDFNEPKQKKLEAYPFEENLENISKITKEYFRCKGNPLNPERIDESDPDNIKVYLDCEGSSKHSLPLMHNNKEGVYPVLIDILNYIQKKTKKRVIITCGHRCPKHNQYSDFDSSAKLSKHLIGAEVDFYVEGYEQKYLEILNLIEKYYLEKLKYKNNKNYTEFFEDTKSKDFLKNSAYYNKEILVKIYDFDEARDFSNRHPYPYISIEVLYDSQEDKKVSYSWEKAHRGYLTY